ncbi:hypothetical protein Arub01_02580 [Actinomadura rubrobrunea]|uniref:Aminoglycoside phosphotransferase domain-containing protein n=1 Tax=Actinomadura rubrobrunea TaxID=115335 RepID=A0A9W6USV2_9ACTN|nr:phosphotransferase [Actinomadura rubrobrunea]GLW62014.1 hypothetical protein Arub01_02580 [Actinomadura rubrobrunea]
MIPEGMMNRNWRLVTARGAFHLRRILDVDLRTARRNLAALAALAEDGLPVRPALPAPDGALVVEVGGHGYCAFPWTDGVHVAGTDLAPRQAADLGALVARLHHALLRTPPAPGSASARAPRPAAVECPERALARTARLLDHISSLRSPQTADLTFVVHLRRRTHLLRRYGALRPARDRPPGPYGWTHGDLRADNLLWRDRAVVAVLDWDRLAVRPLMEELARAALALFAREDGVIDLPRLAAFTNGYRSIAPVDERALGDAVRRVWWSTMCDHWHLEYYYGHCCGHPHRSGPGALDWWLNACGRAFVRDSRMLDWWTRHWQDVRDAFAGRGSASPLAA